MKGENQRFFFLFLFLQLLVIKAESTYLVKLFHLVLSSKLSIHLLNCVTLPCALYASVH